MCRFLRGLGEEETCLPQWCGGACPPPHSSVCTRGIDKIEFPRTLIDTRKALAPQLEWQWPAIGICGICELRYFIYLFLFVIQGWAQQNTFQSSPNSRNMRSHGIHQPTNKAPSALFYFGSFIDMTPLVFVLQYSPPPPPPPPDQPPTHSLTTHRLNHVLWLAVCYYFR